MASESNKFIGQLILECEEQHIASWSPGANGENPTQVHIITKAKDLPWPILIRIKSRAAAEELIAALQSHTDEVWPR